MPRKITIKPEFEIIESEDEAIEPHFESVMLSQSPQSETMSDGRASDGNTPSGKVHSGKKRPLHKSDTISSNKRKIASPLPTSGSQGVRTKADDIVNYGSEEEVDDDEEDDIGQQGFVVPRAARILFNFDDEQDEELPTSTTNDEFVASDLSTWSSSCDMEKFDFEWKQFPPSQTPEQRRLPFNLAFTGPGVCYSSVYEAFSHIWDRKIMELIAAETNVYAQQLIASMEKTGTMQAKSRIKRWVDTTADEIYVYFAIVLATGVVVKTRLEEYWNKSQDIFSTPGFGPAMNNDRFLLLSRCLHFQDNAECNRDSMTRAEAKVFKLQPILDHLNNKFSQLYVPSQNVALDKSLTTFKGWLDNNKEASAGIRTYELCEPQTGYLWRFEVHTGYDHEPNEGSPISGTIPTLVLRLLDGLENQGYTVWMDDQYNSPALARELKLRGFDCVGPLQTTRQFVPIEIKNLTKDNMERGQVSGCTSGDVDLIVWRDRRRVAFVSTYHGLASAMCGDTLKPAVATDYNNCMGGLDRKDQMLATYPIERKRTKIWYKKFFRRLLNASTLNAFILYRKHNTISHRNFRKTLVNELLSRHGHASLSVPTPELQRHFPAQFDCVPWRKGERQRRVCVACKKRTNSLCKDCNVPLCVFTCFEPYHADQKYLWRPHKGGVT